VRIGCTFPPGFPLARDGDSREHWCRHRLGDARVIEPSSATATDLHIDFRLGTSPASGRPSLTIVVDGLPDGSLLPVLAAAVLSSLQSVLGSCGREGAEGHLH
jgi:hypothetical protein